MTKVNPDSYCGIYCGACSVRTHGETGRVGLTVSVFVFLWILPVHVHGEKSAQTRPLSDAIHLQPGATCLQQTSVVEHVRAWLGSERIDERLKVEVTGNPDHAQHVSILVSREQAAPTVRKFAPGPSACEQLHAVVGLAIAIAVHAAVIEDMGIGPIQPAPVAEPPRWSWGLDAIATPKLAQGAGLGAALHLNLTLNSAFDARLSLFGLYLWGGRVEGVGIKGGFFTLASACRLDGCAGYQVLQWFRIRGCMGIAAGPLLVWGDGFERSERSAAPWVAVANALGVQLKFNKYLRWNAEMALIAPLRGTVVEVRTFNDDPVAETDLSDPGILISTGPEFIF